MKIDKKSKARVPERTSLHSFNLLWLMWAVCGGFFITNFILSNWLQVLLKPVFEKPVDTTQVRMIMMIVTFDFHTYVNMLHFDRFQIFLWNMS